MNAKLVVSHLNLSMTKKVFQSPDFIGDKIIRLNDIQSSIRLWSGEADGI
ncbi:MAG: hypothetical protein KJN95_12035 [Gammaproteobacteria bacterium]|nr:hypothetical protein [Gammaproteobacteria bacterium]